MDENDREQDADHDRCVETKIDSEQAENLTGALGSALPEKQGADRPASSSNLSQLICQLIKQDMTFGLFKGYQLDVLI